MGILVRDLKQGDHIIFKEENNALVETTVKFIKQGKYTEQWLIHCADDALLIRSEDDVFQLAVLNLVPKARRDHLVAHGTTPYEVLVFHTDLEYDLCQDEPCMKKRIMAKFRDYGDALAYAQGKAIQPMYSHVILRA